MHYLIAKHVTDLFYINASRLLADENCEPSYVILAVPMKKKGNNLHVRKINIYMYISIVMYIT